MDRIREWSFPVALLTAWVAVAAYTLSSLGQAHATAAAAHNPAVVAPEMGETIEVVAPVVAKHMSKAHKRVAHRDPRS